MCVFVCELKNVRMKNEMGMLENLLPQRVKGDRRKDESFS